MKKQSLVSILSMVLVVLLTLTSCGVKTEPGTSSVQAASFIKSIVPTTADERGVAPDSSFSIELMADSTEEELYARLSLYPETDYTLTGKNKSWTLTPAKLLGKNMVYAIRAVATISRKLRESYAFQTQASLQVSGTFPANQSHYTDTSTGIEFTFNVSDVVIKDHFSISPKVEGTFETMGYRSTFIPSAPLEEGTVYTVMLAAGVTTATGYELKERYTFSFETMEEHSNPPLYFSDALYMTFIEGDPILISVGENHYSEEASEGISSEETELVQSVVDSQEVVPDGDGAVASDGGAAKVPELAVNPATAKDAEVPLVRLKTGDRSIDNPIMEIYRYSTMEDYAATILSQTFSNVDTPDISFDSLTLVGRFDAQLIRPMNKYYLSLILPENLPLGEYLVNLSYTSNGVQFLQQRLFSVTRYSTYLQSSEKDFLFWINDVNTGEAVEGAEVSIEQKSTSFTNPDEVPFASSAVTSGDGIASMSIESLSIESTGEFSVSVRKDGKLISFSTYFIYNWLSEEAGENPRLDKAYQSFIFTDREQYRPTDTVSFWGSILPRNSTAPLPEKVWARISGGGKNIGQNLELSLDKNGVFSGEIQTNMLLSGYYSMMIVDKNGYVYANKGLSVLDYENPAYVVDATADKSYYYFNEEVSLSLSASFYDGSPVRNELLSVYMEYYDGIINTTLGESGTATIKLTPAPPWELAWYPLRANYSTTSNTTGEHMAVGSNQITLLPSDVAAMMDYNLTQGSVSIKTASLDVSKIDVQPESAGSWRDSLYKHYAKDPIAVPVTIQVKKNTITKTPIESIYDAVNKKNIVYYDYTHDTSVVETIQTETKDGVLELSIDPRQNSALEFYWVEASFKNTAGAVVTIPSENPMNYYASPDLQYDYTFFPATQKYQLARNETTELSLYNNNERVKNTGKVLYTISQDDLLEVGLYTDSHSLNLVDGFLPNIAVAGAYFDGKYTHPIYQRIISYDYSEHELSLKIESSQKEYRPGDSATIELTLTDQKGNPVEGSVYVAVVGEASFAAAEQSLDILSSLYASIYFPSLSQEINTRNRDIAKLEYSQDAMALAGGGGLAQEGAVRRNFRETAYTEALRTDSDGKATVTFTLPDDITSWRVSALAVTKDVDAGSSKTNAVATLPFYISTIITPTYLVGDSVVVAVEGQGRASVLGASLDFEITLKNSAGGVLSTDSPTSVLGNRTFVDFGKLAKGDYTVVIQGASGEYADAVEQKISVVKSGLTARQVHSTSAEQWDWSIVPQRFPVEVIAHDKELSILFETLSRLASENGERTEVLTANYYARLALYNLSKNPNKVKPILPETLPILGYYGIFSALPGGEADLSTTAKLLAVLKSEFLDKVDVDLLYQSTSATERNPHEKAMALLSLAIIEQPVLLNIQDKIKNDADFSIVDKLYLAAGLVSLGDYTGGLAYYSSLADKMQSTETTLSFSLGSPTENDEATAAALLLTSLMNHSESVKLARTLLDAGKDLKQQVPYNLELLAFAQNYSPLSANLDATVTYPDHDGKDVTTRFAEQDNHVSILLNQAEFSEKRLQSTGDVHYQFLYEDYVFEKNPSPDFTIKKTYESVSAGYEVGDIIKVSLEIVPNSDTPHGYYRFYDYIPSGMRHMNLPVHDYSRESVFYSLENEGQQVSTGFYLYDTEKPITTAFYYVTCTYPGEFVSSSALIFKDSGELVGSSDTTTVVIR